MRTLQKFASSAAAILIAATGSGCTGVPDGVQTITGFELDRYLGTWYEVARLDHRFERGMSDVTANYSMREDGGVNVINTGFETEKGEWASANGKAYFVGDPDLGQLKVSFFGPFYGGYNIVELDKQDYQYSLVVGPNRDYLWILSRSPQLDEEILSALVEKANSLGFPTNELIYVEHSRH